MSHLALEPHPRHGPGCRHEPGDAFANFVWWAALRVSRAGPAERSVDFCREETIMFTTSYFEFGRVDAKMVHNGIQDHTPI